MSVRDLRPGRLVGRMRAPPSKSYTHRAFIAAFLAGRRCEVRRPLESDDTRATRDGLRALGASLQRSGNGWVVSRSPEREGFRRSVRCGESGTTLRFLSAVAALRSEPVLFSGKARLSARPMGPLYGALRTLGATVRPPANGRALPCTIRGPLESGKVSIRGDLSSQFTSALLMVLPTVLGESELLVRGPTVSEPYIEATLAVLQERGIHLHPTRHGYRIPGGQEYPGGRINVPGDASSAAYLWAAAAATGGDVIVDGVPPHPPQADLAILPILSKMGAHVHRSARSIRVSGSLTRPVSVNLTDSPDLFPLVAVLAAMVPKGRSELRGAPQLAFKESDRRVQSIRLARAVGARVTPHRSRIDVVGVGSPRPLDLPNLRDHRVVMSATVAALAATGSSRLGHAESVEKSFPDFWTSIRELTRDSGADP